MFYFLLLFHLAAAVVLILTVLLQSGKAGDLASAFGGASSQTAFGARGAATFLTKATTLAAIIFMFSSLGLHVLSSSSADSVLEGLDEAQRPAAEDTATPSGQEGAPAGTQPAPPPESTPTGSGETTPPPSGQQGSSQGGQQPSSQSGSN